MLWKTSSLWSRNAFQKLLNRADKVKLIKCFRLSVKTFENSKFLKGRGGSYSSKKNAPLLEKVVLANLISNATLLSEFKLQRKPGRVLKQV